MLETKRKVVQRYIDQGLYPYTRRYLGTLRNHFSTLGVNGINEMVRNFSGDADDLTTPAGHALALRLLDRVRARMTEFQEQTGHLYNLEATPAEGTTTASPARTASAIPVSCRPAPRPSLTTPTPASCRWAIPTTRSRRWRNRRRCKASTPAAPCCTCT